MVVDGRGYRSRAATESPPLVLGLAAGHSLSGVLAGRLGPTTDATLGDRDTLGCLTGILRPINLAGPAAARQHISPGQLQKVHTSGFGTCIHLPTSDTDL